MQAKQVSGAADVPRGKLDSPVGPRVASAGAAAIGPALRGGGARKLRLVHVLMLLLPFVLLHLLLQQLEFWRLQRLLLVHHLLLVALHQGMQWHPIALHVHKMHHCSQPLTTDSLD